MYFNVSLHTFVEMLTYQGLSSESDTVGSVDVLDETGMYVVTMGR